MSPRNGPFHREGRQSGEVPDRPQAWHGGPGRQPWAQGRWAGRGGPHGLYAKRRFLFFRIAGIFAALALLVLVALGLILGLWVQGGRYGPLELLVLAGCAIPALFAVLAALLAGFTFRRYGSPLAEVMAAADAVAEGDLSVRVRENVPGELGRLARSFNRMTEELAREEQQRRNLTADVAHELRTPLHIIQGNLEGILDGVYEPTAEHLAATLEETRLLARLVNDLQTLSLAESGQLPLHPAPVQAADLLADVATSFSVQAEEAGIQILLDVPQGPGDDEALTLEADADRLDQVLSNLVGNALRHTPPGGRIHLRAEPAPEGVRLAVSDTGAGIPPEDLPFIFDRFWRGDRARSRSNHAGSGLGLAIARGLVQAHGGRIRAESEPGQGTTFVIELPRQWAGGE